MNITRPTEINTGGVNPVMFCYSDEVSSVTVTSALLATVVLKAGKSWKYIYATDGTISLTSKEEETPAGVKITYQVEMLVPRDQVDVELSLVEMSNRGIIILAANKNGVVRVFGSPANPMRKTGKLTWPEEVEGFNGTRLSFTGEFDKPAPYVTTSISSIPFPVPA